MTNELEKLKAENKRFKETLDDLFKVQYKLADNNKKLRQCLTEIKEIAENAYCLTNATNKDMAQFAKQILQKISECEGN
jgi:ABC-type transporter Mla subunit MlaD